MTQLYVLCTRLYTERGGRGVRSIPSPNDTGARRLVHLLPVQKRLQLPLVGKASERVWAEVLHPEVSPRAGEDLPFRLLAEPKLREHLMGGAGRAQNKPRHAM